MLRSRVFAVLLASALPILGLPVEGISPRAILARQSTDIPAPIVDVGYGRYQGYYNSANNLNIYRGVRFASRPKRFQKPQPPEPRPEIVSQAVENPPRCPQTPLAGMIRGSTWEDAVYGNEDCLFLNVFSPKSAKKLPVLFWIHGGGYGAGSAASFDFSEIAKSVGNGFVTVVTQYRLGALGFASSTEVLKKGVTNAGLHDMQFALEWVQKHIEAFGGDPNQVTISGESAGGGSVMLMAMANGGKDKTRLFRRAIASSPYLPTQPSYDDGLPEEYYRQFAQSAGCKGTKESWFQCLSDAATLTVQNASALTTLGAKYGQWAFIPVTDGSLVVDRPTQQLLHGQLNGERILVGNNANEGTYFVPQNITTEAQLRDFVALDYPHLAPADLTAIMDVYRIPANFTRIKFDSDGLHAPFATEVSNFTVGWQQAANNLYAETTFVCPAYWLAMGYTESINPAAKGKLAWRYQFSVTDAFHGADIAPLTADPATGGTPMNQEFRGSFQAIWGRFITAGDPTLPQNESQKGSGVSAAAPENWKAWGIAGTYAGGNGQGSALLNINVTSSAPQVPDWQIVDGDAWEGGRGARCALWARVGANAQE